MELQSILVTPSVVFNGNDLLNVESPNSKWRQYWKGNHFIAWNAPMKRKKQLAS